MEFNKKLLSSIYFNPNQEGSFGSPLNLFKAVKKQNQSLTKKQVQNWLKEQEAYSLFQKTIRKFPRLKTITSHIDEQWQADLMDISWFAKDNNGTKYLLVVIDVFSRFGWALPIKDKKAETVAKAMKKIFKIGRIPEKLQTDQGKEFKNSVFMNLMLDFNINFFTSTDDAVKCALVERFNRTLRSRIYRFMYYRGNNKYIDVLQDIVEGYNKNYHRSIKEAPINVNKENEATILFNQREVPELNVNDKLKNFEYVRIARKKDIFEKGASSNWTKEIFKIIYRKKTPTTFIYKLEDLKGEPLTSIFYPNELSGVNNIKKRGRPRKQK